MKIERGSFAVQPQPEPRAMPGLCIIMDIAPALPVRKPIMKRAFAARLGESFTRSTAPTNA